MSLVQFIIIFMFIIFFVNCLFPGCSDRGALLRLPAALLTVRASLRLLVHSGGHAGDQGVGRAGQTIKLVSISPTQLNLNHQFNSTRFHSQCAGLGKLSLL